MTEPKTEPIRMMYEQSVIGDRVATFTWPMPMAREDYDDFKLWIELVLRKAGRCVVDKRAAALEGAADDK